MKISEVILIWHVISESFFFKNLQSFLDDERYSYSKWLSRISFNVSDQNKYYWSNRAFSRKTRFCLSNFILNHFTICSIMNRSKLFRMSTISKTNVRIYINFDRSDFFQEIDLSSNIIVFPYDSWTFEYYWWYLLIGILFDQIVINFSNVKEMKKGV